MTTKHILQMKQESTCPTGKIQHDDRSARNHITALILMNNRNACSYRCPHCGELHVTRGIKKTYATYQFNYERAELQRADSQHLQ